jgi:DNA polymerase-1
MSVVLDNIGRADGGLVAVDTETTGIDGIKDGRHYCVGISFAYRISGNLHSDYIPIRHSSGNTEPQKIRQVQDALVSASRSGALIFHNSKFDIHSLATLGNDWRWLFEEGRFFDTMIIAHMHNEELPSKELDWLSKHFLNDSKDNDRLSQYTKIFGWEDVPVELMAPYAKKDAELTYRLWEILWPQLKREEIA